MFDWLIRTERMAGLEREVLLLRTAAHEARERNEEALARLAAAEADISALQQQYADLQGQQGAVANQIDSLERWSNRAQTELDRSSGERERLTDLATVVRQLDYRLKAHREEADKVSAALVERIELVRGSVKQAASEPD